MLIFVAAKEQKALRTTMSDGINAHIDGHFFYALFQAYSTFGIIGYHHFRELTEMNDDIRPLNPTFVSPRGVPTVCLQDGFGGRFFIRQFANKQSK